MKSNYFNEEKALYAPEIMRKFREIYQEVFAERSESFKFGEQWHGFTLMKHASKVPSFEYEDLYDFSDSPEIESFAKEFKYIKKKHKLTNLAVLSYLPIEGRTSFITSFAKYAAKKLRLRVLVLDYTFTQSPMTKALKTKPHFGTRDVIDGSIQLRNVIFISEKDDYALIPSTAGFPRDHKNAGRFPQFLAKSKGLFDLILIDTPPYREYPHSMKSLAKLLDGVILLKSDTVPEKKFLAMLKSLQKDNINIVGWIANSNS